MANGNVHVFNLFSETIDPFSTNGLGAGTINGWDTNYTPQQLKVGRVINPNEAPGKFVNGNNKVIFKWPSGLYSFAIKIDGDEFPITQNLMLYVSRTKWVLYNEFGVLRDEGDVIPGPSFGLKI